MNWHKNFLQTMRQKSSYKRLAPDEHSKGDVPKVSTRHEFSMTLTVINFLLTTLTVVLIFVFRSPIHQIPVPHQHCTCPETTTDTRYKNPNMNPDIKRVAGYCEFSERYGQTFTDKYAFQLLSWTKLISPHNLKSSTARSTITRQSSCKIPHPKSTQHGKCSHQTYS